MNVLFAASEGAPFLKTGGLGDVVGALAKAVSRKGHCAQVILPLYGEIKETYGDRMEYIGQKYIDFGWRRQYMGLFRCQVENVAYYFIDNEYYFKRGRVYGEYDDGERFGFFSKAILDAVPWLAQQPDILHLNDWQTALASAYFNLYYRGQEAYRRIKTVFTIHNIQYQGRYGKELLENVLGIDEAHFDSGFLACDGDVNFMKAAIVASDAVTTVSPSYAGEIVTPYYGQGLDGILRLYRHKLKGIRNGIDTELYDPRTNPNLAENFGPDTLDKKQENKKALLAENCLQAEADTPVISIVTRFAEHKGMDLVAAVLEDILSDDIRLIVLGTGEWKYEQMFIRAKQKFPDKIGVNILFSQDMADQIYAGSDIFLMPSRSEPCGLAQMMAMRYGAVPVVRETGGLKDTVFPYVDYLGTGNGFTFASYNAHDMLHVIREACRVYRYNKAGWRSLQERGMTTDFSWDAPADDYLALYQNLK